MVTTSAHNGMHAPTRGTAIHAALGSVIVAWILTGLASPASAQTFQYVLAPLGNNVHASWTDYNNDGYADFYTGDRLYRNNGGTTFTDVGNPIYGDGVWADYNNDGWMDFFTYSNNGAGSHLNNKNGTFQVTYYYPVVGTQYSAGAVMGDFNGDHYADVYLGGFENFATGEYYPDKILTNNQSGAFGVTWTQGNDAVTTPGRPRPARGVTSADWDRDGDLDIYVSNYRLEPNAFLRNDGSGNFTDLAVALNAQATSPGYNGGHSIGAAFGDFDNDGRMDLFAANFAHPGQPESRFLKNRGPAFSNTFLDMGTGGVAYQESYASPVFGDVDNDGDLDLYITTVYTSSQTTGGVQNYPRLYLNQGNFNFVDATAAWGLPLSGDNVSTYQAAFADYDNDGYLDLITDGKLYHNSGGSNHWLEVTLDGGTLYGRSPIGAQVMITVNGKKILRQIESGVGEGNQSDQTLHFGLGTYTGPLDLEIFWPGADYQYVTVDGVDQKVVVSRFAVPEPGVLTLLLTGGAFGLVRRRA